MRQFTEAEKEAQLIDWVACPDMSPEYSDYEIHRDGFIAGLDHSAEQLAALTAERDGLRALVERVNEIGPNLRIDTFVQGNWTIQHLKLIELLKDCQRTK